MAQSAGEGTDIDGLYYYNEIGLQYFAEKRAQYFEDREHTHCNHQYSQAFWKGRNRKNKSVLWCWKIPTVSFIETVSVTRPFIWRSWSYDRQKNHVKKMRSCQTTVVDCFQKPSNARRNLVQMRNKGIGIYWLALFWFPKEAFFRFSYLWKKTSREYQTHLRKKLPKCRGKCGRKLPQVEEMIGK